jgi:hypothetical protein
VIPLFCLAVVGLALWPVCGAAMAGAAVCGLALLLVPLYLDWRSWNRGRRG